MAHARGACRKPLQLLRRDSLKYESVHVGMCMGMWMCGGRAGRLVSVCVRACGCAEGRPEATGGKLGLRLGREEVLKECLCSRARWPPHLARPPVHILVDQRHRRLHLSMPPNFASLRKNCICSCQLSRDIYTCRDVGCIVRPKSTGHSFAQRNRPVRSWNCSTRACVVLMAI